MRYLELVNTDEPNRHDRSVETESDPRMLNAAAAEVLARIIRRYAEANTMDGHTDLNLRQNGSIS